MEPFIPLLKSDQSKLQMLKGTVVQRIKRILQVLYKEKSFRE